MADNLQWIRFSTGKEKQVPKHIALDPSVQKSQNFQPIDKPGGNTLVTAGEAILLKKNVAVVSSVNQEAAAVGNSYDPAGDPAKELYEQNKAGKSFAEIAKPLGLHWKSVEKLIADYKKANQLVDETPTL